MTRARPVTLKHLAVTVLVVVLVNAQLTWWIVFVLRENRTRLGLERGRMVAAAEHEAERLAHRLERAEGRSPPPSPEAPEPGASPRPRRSTGGRLRTSHAPGSGPRARPS
jgi:hypothetical protein